MSYNKKENSFSVKDLPSEINEILSDKLNKISSSDSFLKEKILNLTSKYDPIDLANVSGYYSPKIAYEIFKSLNNKLDKSYFISSADQNVVQWIIKFTNEQELKEIMKIMSADDISDIFEMLERSETLKLKKVINYLDPSKKHKVKAILSHTENSIARFMSTEFIALGIESTVDEAIDIIKKADYSTVQDSIFIVSKFGELLGKTKIIDIIKYSEKGKVIDIPRDPTYRILANDSREIILTMTEHLDDYGSLPVVDYSGSLVGTLHSSDIVKIIQDVSQDTLGAIGGTEELEDEHSAFEKITSRSPWLFMTLASGMLSATVITKFSSISHSILFTVSFIPLITGMTGNIGIQSSTVIIRSMAISTWNSSKARKMIKRESLTGSMIGLMFGFIVGAALYIIDATGGNSFDVSALQIGLTVGSGLFLSSMWSSTLGVIAPSFFSFINIDPAVSAGPMVTALNDVVAMIIYLLNALLISNLMN